MFVSEVPEYVIDLALDESSRWAEVIARDTPVAGRIVEGAAKEFERVPELLRWVFARLYQRTGGFYQGEIAAWANALDVSVGTATVLNCLYELSHLRWPKVFGCTAGVRWVEGLGMVHVRNLDWPLPAMGDATRVFRFHRGTREFLSIGVPAHVGVLSGMVPHAYSVTINWAPPIAFPSFDFGPAFLLRNTLEICDNYDDAVQALSQTHLSTSVFYTVCGSEKNQACVIERTQREAIVRPLSQRVLVQANHHVAESFHDNNKDILVGVSDDDLFSLAGSGKRADTLSATLAEIHSPCTLDALASPLNRPPVLNSDTCQQMVFCPASGEARVWRRLAKSTPENSS